MAIISQNTAKQGFFDNPGYRVSTLVENVRQITPFYAKQTQFPKNQNCLNFFTMKNLRKNPRLRPPKKQTQTKPIQSQFQK
jgi:hypothetical protein